MAQITYIDTGPTRREQTPRAPGRAAAPRFWRAAARVLVRRRVAILAGLALYRFAALGMGEMQQWDEAIYALRAQAILQFGALWDQSVFMLGGAYYAAHPPLYVWCSAASVLLFGDHLWAYRLTSAIAAALLVPLLYRLARSLMPPLRALLVAGIFAVLPLPALYSHLGQLDLLLTFCMTAALLFALRSIRGGRAGDTALAGLALGAALMTKLLFALAVPAAVAAAAVLLPARYGRRALRVAVSMTLVSLPLWLPWALSFAWTHGGGPSFLFSSSLPLGATFAGQEGTAKDTGILYYLNQLAVNLSVLAPFAVYSLWKALRRGARMEWSISAMTVVLTLAALMVMRSSFEVYLIPILPLLVLHAIRGVSLLRTAQRRTLLGFSLAAALLLPWSLFHAWREAVKNLGRAIAGAPLPDGSIPSALLLVTATAAAAGAVWLLYRRNRLRPLHSLPLTGTVLLVLAGSTLIRLWLLAPGTLDNGARLTTVAARGSNAVKIFIVGNGVNPQLTFYFGGSDIGWADVGSSDTEWSDSEWSDSGSRGSAASGSLPGGGVPGGSRRTGGEGLRFERLEPRALGADGIRAHIAAAMRTRPVAVLVERDEIAQGAYDAARDVLPAGVTIRLRTSGYLLAGNAALLLPKSVATEVPTLEPGVDATREHGTGAGER